MSLDAYSLCPGGTGKKIKFCCPDFLPELEKIDRMIEGEQFNACLQNIDQLEQKGQFRACLMAIKSELLRVTGQVAVAPGYVADFVHRFPQSSAAWSEAALRPRSRKAARLRWPNCNGRLRCATAIFKAASTKRPPLSQAC